MAKTIKIPDDCTRLIVCINGVVYEYAGGTTVSVPDDVAAAIMEREDMKPKPGTAKSMGESLDDLKTAVRALTLDLETVSAEVEALDGRMDALDDDKTGAVPVLDGRVDALDTPETGAIALLDARLKVLENAQNGGGGG